MVSNSAQELAESFGLLIGSLFAAALALASIVSYGCMRALRPLTVLNDLMGHVAKDDLSRPVPYTERKNEIGDIARAVQVSIDSARQRLVLESEAAERSRHTRIYQRLIANDPDDAIDIAEDAIEESSVEEFYNTEGMAVLRQASIDYINNARAEHRLRIASGMDELLDEIRDQHLDTLPEGTPPDAVPWSGVAGADRHRDARRGPA